ncbi:MAG: hypothetical protein COB10_03630 [Planctomycetota bacterium]|nr:MAG: hypothetical protein COB10_03630 [Planctomycetota bacterium]
MVLQQPIGVDVVLTQFDRIDVMAGTIDRLAILLGGLPEDCPRGGRRFEVVGDLIDFFALRYRLNRS